MQPSIVAREHAGEPALLRRSVLAAAGGTAVRVEHDHPPRAEAIGVIPARREPEVRPRRRGVGGPVLVVPERRPRPAAEAAPGVAALELRRGCTLVDRVAQHRDRARDLRDQRRRRLVPVRPARGDVSCGDQGRRRREQRQRGERARGEAHAGRRPVGRVRSRRRRRSPRPGSRREAGASPAAAVRLRRRLPRSPGTAGSRASVRRRLLARAARTAARS